MPIVYWHREKGREEEEKVLSEIFMRWAYQTPAGRVAMDKLFTRRWVSVFYGRLQDRAWSTRKIPAFVKDFNINMAEFEAQEYRSFNEFFIRKFKPGARTFTTVPGHMPAFAEARYLAFESVSAQQELPIKGAHLYLSELLDSRAQAEIFLEGPAYIARLCPVDYHRFHFPDDGRVVESRVIPGRFHSVNPLAIERRGAILFTNERQVSILETANFGRLAYIEVGAFGVGKIVQTYTGSEFQRGDEKGYFLFGGSTVILLGERGRWRPDVDLLAQTARGRETFVKLGDKIAERI